MHARQLRPGQIGPEAIMQQPVQIAHAQRGQSHLICALGAEQRRRLERRPHVGCLADRRQHLQPFAGHPAQREWQHARRGRVQPLQIVDRYEHIALGTECRQDVQEREPDRLRSGRRISRLVQKQGDAQRPPPRSGQRRVDLVETGPTRSASPVNASAASASAARCTSTLVACAVASSTAICHSSVLPIPGSPRSTNDCNSGPARNPPGGPAPTHERRPVAGTWLDRSSQTAADAVQGVGVSRFRRGPWFIGSFLAGCRSPRREFAMRARSPPPDGPGPNPSEARSTTSPLSPRARRCAR